jgi:hypothetical protein
MPSLWGMLKRSNFMRSKSGFFMRSKVFIKYCIIVQESEKAIGALEALEDHYFTVFYLT